MRGKGLQRLGDCVKAEWESLLLVLMTLGTRLYLLRVYDIELSQDGFAAVRTLTIWQTQGLSALPHDLLDRVLLHPLYMLLLGVWRVLIPASFDFYLAARLLSTLFACVAIVLLFRFTRSAFGRVAAWCATLFLVLAPTLLWESIAILSSTLFLALYIAVLLALLQARHMLAFGLGLLAALVRYEGVVLIALTFSVLLIRDVRARQFRRNDWLVGLALTLAFPLTLIAGSVWVTGDPLQFIGVQSMASIWLRFLAPGDFFKRGTFFITQYPALFPAPIVGLGVVGILIALFIQRTRATMLLLLLSALYILFFELLVFFNYTTLETRFLMYPGLPLLVFAGVTLTSLWSLIDHVSRFRSHVSGWAPCLLPFAFYLFALCLQQSNLDASNGRRDCPPFSSTNASICWRTAVRRARQRCSRASTGLNSPSFVLRRTRIPNSTSLTIKFNL